MQTIKRTPEMRSQGLMLFVWIPILMLNIALFTNKYLNELAIKSALKGNSLVWISILTVLILISLVLAQKGKKFSIWILGFTLLPLVIIDFYMAFRGGYYSLGFWAVFISVLGITHLGTLSKVLGRAYYNPEIKWFEGSPKKIPGITARLFGKIEMQKAELSNLDHSGCFVVGEGLNPDIDRIELSSGERFINKSALPVMSLERCNGYGIKFKVQDLDDEKEIKEFVDYVRSRGYVE